MEHFAIFVNEICTWSMLHRMWTGPQHHWTNTRIPKLGLFPHLPLFWSDLCACPTPLIDLFHFTNGNNVAGIASPPAYDIVSLVAQLLFFQWVKDLLHTKFESITKLAPCQWPFLKRGQKTHVSVCQWFHLVIMSLSSSDYSSWSSNWLVLFPLNAAGDYAMLGSSFIHRACYHIFPQLLLLKIQLAFLFYWYDAWYKVLGDGHHGYCR